MSDPGGNTVLAWAVVANVEQTTTHGPDGSELHDGLEHFSGGTKVWVLPGQWGDGWELAFVVGRHRGSQRFARLVVPLRHLTDFRVEAVYSPAVARELTKPRVVNGEQWQLRQWESREDAERVLQRHPVTAAKRKGGRAEK